MTERVTGIGGVFFKARDVTAQKDWYRSKLGLDLENGPFTVFHWRERGRDDPGATVWALFKDESDYFGSPTQRAMVNFRVRDLDAMLEQLRGAGVRIIDQRHDDENGRFAWVEDPEGNRIELWQPAAGR